MKRQKAEGNLIGGWWPGLFTHYVLRITHHVIIALLLFLLFSSLLFPFSFPASADKRVAEERGAAGISQALRRLPTIASALHTGAHPDDEDSGLLAYLARGRMARTAYLSLTRGEGGQNLIGPELYEALGVIRTEELLAARRLDGAQQFFTRAYEFGFSKSVEETLNKWGREAVLDDMVRIIRTFRPLVIISVWSGTPRDGHAHHQSAGMLAREAFRAAGDPNRFPDQIKEGLRPWQAKKFYIRAFRRGDGEPLSEGARELPPETDRSIQISLNTGQYDPVLGRTYYQIAMEGRSRHRTQDMGATEPIRSRPSMLRLVDSAIQSNDEKDIFDGIDVTLTGIADFAGGEEDRLLGLRAALRQLQQLAQRAIDGYKPFTPEELLPTLAEGLKQVRALREQVKQSRLSDATRYEIDFLLERKEEDFARAIQLAAAIQLDALADTETVVPGQTFTITTDLFSNKLNLSPSGVRLIVPDGWRVVEASSGDQSSGAIGRAGRPALPQGAEPPSQDQFSKQFKVTVALEARPSESYWLREPRAGNLFLWPEDAPKGAPTAPPDVVAVASINVAGVDLTVSQPAQFRYADKSFGEIRRELKVVPALSVSLGPTISVIPASWRDKTRVFNVEVASNVKGAISVQLGIEAPQRWSVKPATIELAFKREGERASASFSVTPPQNVVAGSYQIRAVARSGDQLFSRYYQVIAYPHIETRYLYHPSVSNIEIFDVDVAQALKVGYIAGAGDAVAQALEQLGVEVKMLEANDLASGDLSKYDAIVAGIRAYEVRRDLIANNVRLLDYVRRGGVFIVQYNKYELIEGNFAPYPIKMRRPHDRVTVEEAPVTILEPQHPIFNFPNKITEADFHGWVHERGLYFLSEWDSRYRPLMACNDPGEEPQRGGMVIVDYGQGKYIYTAYAWFRQLPAGVPGAYRIFANMVSLAKVK